MSFNLSDLKIKPHAKGKTEVKVKIVNEHTEEPVHPLFEEENKEDKEENKDEDVDKEKTGDKETKAKKQDRDAYFVDMREIRQIDRDLIIQKLKLGIKEVEKPIVVEEVAPKKQIKVVKKVVLDAPKKAVEEEEKEEDTRLNSVPALGEKAAEEAAVEAVKKPRKQRPTEHLVFEGDADTVVIGSETIEERMPKQDKRIIRASNYYMTNRRIYQQKLADLFKPHKAELMKPDESVSCDFRKEGNKFELLTHQLIVRDYLNLYSPYRGLLIYHGLGSGKTCTSIAIAEGMKTDKPIYVLTPASLSMNFISELKKCGDPIYRRNQYWEFIDTRKEPTYAAPLAHVLALTGDFIRSQGGVWMVNVKKRPNFDSLSADEQVQIEKQIDAMIKAKYRNVNYNANNMMTKLVHYAGGDDINPFDNSVVIVDEAHNLVSRIVNKMKKKDSVSYKIYEYLMSASNAKVVFLSGTPIINYPNEIAIMFNMLRGYIKTWTFTLNVKTSEKINRETILSWFIKDNFKLYDYVEYSGNKLIITRNPYGFVNTYKKTKIQKIVIQV